MTIATLTTSPAMLTMEGVWPANMPVNDAFVFYEGGSPMVLTNLEFMLTLRYSNAEPSAAITLATNDGSLSITQIENSKGQMIPCLAINNASFAGMEGNYVSDLVGRDAGGVVTHYAHGTIVIRNDPLTFFS